MHAQARSRIRKQMQSRPWGHRVRGRWHRVAGHEMRTCASRLGNITFPGGCAGSGLLTGPGHWAAQLWPELPQVEFLVRTSAGSDFPGVCTSLADEPQPRSGCAVQFPCRPEEKRLGQSSGLQRNLTPTGAECPTGLLVACQFCWENNEGKYCLPGK